MILKEMGMLSLATWTRTHSLKAFPPTFHEVYGYAFPITVSKEQRGTGRWTEPSFGMTDVVVVVVVVGAGLVIKLCPTLTTPWTVAFQAPLSLGFPR